MNKRVKRFALKFVAVVLGGLLGVWVARTLPTDAVV